MKLTIRPGTWTRRTEILISLALAAATIEEIIDQTNNGAQLFEGVDESGAIVLAFVLRVDRLACRNVGVIVAAGGGVAGQDLTALVLPTIEGYFVGCESVRMHTERPGLARKVKAQGYRVAEIILEKRLENGIV